MVQLGKITVECTLNFSKHLDLFKVSMKGASYEGTVKPCYTATICSAIIWHYNKIGDKLREALNWKYGHRQNVYNDHRE